MRTTYVQPPMRSGVFSTMDKSVLNLAGWNAFDELSGELSAPDALPSGGAQAEGMFGPCTCFIPREWELHQQRLALFRSAAIR